MKKQFAIFFLLSMSFPVLCKKTEKQKKTIAASTLGGVATVGALGVGGLVAKKKYRDWVHRRTFKIDPNYQELTGYTDSILSDFGHTQSLQRAQIQGIFDATHDSRNVLKNQNMPYAHDKRYAGELDEIIASDRIKEYAKKRHAGELAGEIDEILESERISSEEESKYEEDDLNISDISSLDSIDKEEELISDVRKNTYMKNIKEEEVLVRKNNIDPIKENLSKMDVQYKNSGSFTKQFSSKNSLETQKKAETQEVSTDEDLINTQANQSIHTSSELTPVPKNPTVNDGPEDNMTPVYDNKSEDGYMDEVLYS